MFEGIIRILLANTDHILRRNLKNSVYKHKIPSKLRFLLQRKIFIRMFPEFLLNFFIFAKFSLNFHKNICKIYNIFFL